MHLAVQDPFRELIFERTESNLMFVDLTRCKIENTIKAERDTIFLSEAKMEEGAHSITITK